MDEFFDWLKDLEPAFAVMIAAVAVLVSVMSTFFQQRQLVHLTRYDAVRSKRATAKALREEINALKDLQYSSHVQPVVFRAITSSIGRLNENSIGSVVRFYASLENREQVGQAKLDARADKAVSDLDKFLCATEEENNRLKLKLSVE